MKGKRFLQITAEIWLDEFQKNKENITLMNQTTIERKRKKWLLLYVRIRWTMMINLNHETNGLLCFFCAAIFAFKWIHTMFWALCVVCAATKLTNEWFEIKFVFKKKLECANIAPFSVLRMEKTFISIECSSI